MLEFGIQVEGHFAFTRMKSKASENQNRVLCSPGWIDGLVVANKVPLEVESSSFKSTAKATQ